MTLVLQNFGVWASFYRYIHFIVGYNFVKTLTGHYRVFIFVFFPQQCTVCMNNDLSKNHILHDAHSFIDFYYDKVKNMI